MWVKPYAGTDATGVVRFSFSGCLRFWYDTHGISSWSTPYLQPASALFHLPERHLYIHEVHGLAEGEGDFALAFVVRDCLGARPSRFNVSAVAVVSQRGQAAVRTAAGVAAIPAGVSVVGGGRDVNGGQTPDLDVAAVIVVLVGAGFGTALHIE